MSTISGKHSPHSTVRGGLHRIVLLADRVIHPQAESDSGYSCRLSRRVKAYCLKAPSRFCSFDHGGNLLVMCYIDGSMSNVGILGL